MSVYMWDCNMLERKCFVSVYVSLCISLLKVEKLWLDTDKRAMVVFLDIRF